MPPSRPSGPPPRAARTPLLPTLPPQRGPLPAPKKQPRKRPPRPRWRGTPLPPRRRRARRAGPPQWSAAWVDPLTSPTGYAAIGVVLLAIVVLAVRRRRREEDDDPLYSVMSADDAGAGSEDAYTESDPVVAWGRSDEDAEEAEHAAAPAANFHEDEPVGRDGSQQLSLARVRAAEAQSEEQPEPYASAEEPTPAAEAMVAEPVAVAYAPSPEPSEGSQIAAELEGRVREMEHRLEQLAEARERLERQVAAQTEELRVQRAAIARTQRVVRSMTKGEDVASEPVPRVQRA